MHVLRCEQYLMQRRSLSFPNLIPERQQGQTFAPPPGSSRPHIGTVRDTPRLAKCIGVGLFHGAGRKITFDAWVSFCRGRKAGQ